MRRRRLSHKSLFIFLFVLAVIATLFLNLKTCASVDDYMYLVVESKSMQPTLDIGSFITIRRNVPASSINAAPYPNGDIIVFYLPKASSSDADQFVAHRAVANLTRDNGLVYFRTKGDGNAAEDAWPDYRGENYSWNGMISEKLLVGKVVSYAKDFYADSVRTRGRYVIWECKHWFTVNRTVRALRDSGYVIAGDPDWLLNVNYTYLNFSLKSTTVDLSRPYVTTRNTEGGYDLNATANRIMEDGSIGERLLSTVRANQPARVTKTWSCHDPGFGIGFNPTAFVMGNNFETASEDEPLRIRFVVNRTEVLSDTPWGQNSTYVLEGYAANETQTTSFTCWCDAESGLIIKQIDYSVTADYISYGDMLIAETGIEFVVPTRQIPSPQNTAAAVVVGVGASVGLSALSSALTASQPVGQAASKLSLREAVNRFFRFHSEKTIEESDEESVGSSEESRRRKEIGRMVLSVLVSTFAFAVVEADGLPNLLSPSALQIYVPVFLVSVGVITAARGLFGAIANRLLRVRVESRIWAYGLVALILSSLIFLVPFGAAYTTKYKSGRKTKRSRMLMILSKTSLISTLLLFFSLPLLRDLTTLGSAGELLVLAGDAGVLIVTMTVFFSLIPFRPLDGKVLWDCSKLVWLVAIVATGAFFGCYIYQVLTPVMFLIGGVVSACIFAITLSLARPRVR